MLATPRPRRAALAFVAAVAVLLSSVVAAQPDPSGLHVAGADAGQHLTDAAGYALYLFWPDARGASTCVDACALAWPPLVIASAAAQPLLMEGLAPELLGTAARQDGSSQVTYAGWPLYYYVGDAEPGDTYGHLATEDWYLVTPAGSPLGLETGD